jgi:hypothetical protein
MRKSLEKVYFAVSPQSGVSSLCLDVFGITPIIGHATFMVYDWW